MPGVWVEQLRVTGFLDTTCPSTGRPCRLGCFNIAASGENCRLVEIASVPDDQIDVSDVPEAGEDWFRRARLRLPGRSWRDG